MSQEKKVIRIGTLVKLAHGSEAWSLAKDGDKTYLIEDIKLFVKDDYQVTHFVIFLRGRERPVCLSEIINADENEANETANWANQHRAQPPLI